MKRLWALALIPVLAACGSDNPYAGRPLYSDQYGQYRVADCKMISLLGTQVPELYVEFHNTSGQDEAVRFSVNYDGMLPQNEGVSTSVRTQEVLAGQNVIIYFTLNNPPDALCDHDPRVLASL